MQISDNQNSIATYKYTYTLPFTITNNLIKITLDLILQISSQLTTPFQVITVQAQNHKLNTKLIKQQTLTLTFNFTKQYQHEDRNRSLEIKLK